MIFNRKALLGTLQKVGKIVPKNSPIPILADVRIIAGPAGAFVQATDLQAFAMLRIDENEREDARFITPYRELMDFLRKSKSTDIKIVFEKYHLLISDDYVEIKFEREDELNYPVFGDIMADFHIDVVSEDLVAAIDQTEFVAAKEDQRYALSNMQFGFDDSILRLIATDGKQLAIAEVGATMTGKVTEGIVLVSSRYLSFVASLIRRKKPKRPSFPRENDSMMIHIGKNQIQFSGASLSIVIRLSEGRFPGWQGVIPNCKRPMVIFDRTAMITALEFTDQFIDDKHKGVSFCISESEILLHGEFPKGIFEQKVRVKSGDTFAAVTIVLDPKLLVGYLYREPFDDVRMIFSDDKKIMEFQGQSRYFLMPLSKNSKS